MMNKLASQKTSLSLQQLLENAAQQIKKQRLDTLFMQQPQRAEQFALEVGEIYLDYSKNFITPEIMAALIAWAHEQDLPQAIQRLIKGEWVNTTEKRPALHTALRCAKTEQRF